MSYFNIVAQTNENTVVTEYESVTKRSDAYQSEAELEKEFIRLLTEQGYEYLHIHTEAELITNLRKKLEEVNGYTFTDSEWKRFFGLLFVPHIAGQRLFPDFITFLRHQIAHNENQ